MKKTLCFYSYFTVFDEQIMRWLTSQNGWTGEFQEIRIKRCIFEAIWMRLRKNVERFERLISMDR